MVVGTITSVVFGCRFPVSMVIYGDMIDLFLANDYNRAVMAPHIAVDNIGSRLQGYVTYFCVLGCIMFLLGAIAMTSWIWTAERQSSRIRKRFFQSVMRQHIGWFDEHQVGELTARLSDDINNIQNGIGSKISLFLQAITQFLAGYVLGFVRGWKLTLVVASVIPFAAVAMVALSVISRKLTVAEQTAYSKAGGVAEEVLSAIKTVAAFGGEKKEVKRYSHNLKAARSFGIKKGVAAGCGHGSVQLLVYSAFAVAFWYGSQLTRNQEDYSGGRVLQVFLSILIGTMSLGAASPNLATFSIARGAAAKVYEIIELKSEIDSSSDEGLKPRQIGGDVKFEDVVFAYPTRPNVQVLDGFDLEVKVGQTVALVGASGCGKSTTVALLQRFYDPQQGTIKIGGHNIRDLNVGFLREQIGVVSQEPILFAESIAENIRYGRNGVTQPQIEAAAKEANAQDFIDKLPEGYGTQVGERGTQLSGGQKQRLAIARALVRNPRILLLDEATSALDVESESVVQGALDKARMGRTTLIVAHRLSTIKSADLIVALNDGRCIEKGNHEQLMQKRGFYYELVNSQTIGDREGIDDLIDPEVDLSSSPHQSPKLKRSPNSELTRKGSTWSLGEEVFIITRLIEKLPPATISRILRLHSPEVVHVIFGSFAGVLIGAANPVFATILSEILAVSYINSSPDLKKQEEMSVLFSLIIFGVAFVTGICMVVMYVLFAITGENLTMRLRKMAFTAMLRQDMTYFDEEANQVGALTSRLATDASIVKGASGVQAGSLTQSISGLTTALVIALVFGWKLALVVVCFLPIIMACGMVKGKLAKGTDKQNALLLEDGAKIATEAIENIRTVAALTKEKSFLERYSAHFDMMSRKVRLQSVSFGVFFGLTQSIIFFTYAASYGFGATLIENGEMEFKNVFRVFAAITFGGLSVGTVSSIAPDVSKAKLAAAKIFALLDRKPLVDAFRKNGQVPESCTGELRFDDVKFSYPSRSGNPVLSGLSLHVKRGQSLALVGSSGCGKSTSVQLLDRFYDPQSGDITVDGKSIKELRVSWLRAQIGIVAQEPVLFAMSIKDNIAYGDNRSDVTMGEIVEAAKKANIHNFITSLPMGYDTHVGEKGAQLSGGQKQRVAIARALVRNPKILVLDEATSALDAESEKIVQEALDHAMDGRTSIVVAHRLSTIRDADMILVMDEGHVAEIGSHSELMAREGLYYKMVQLHNRTES
ncbi:hypothetical protein CAPTEDRAFT_150102 [Capitella teleta]|uniref:Bile salt export pump n=1 Tax=Capitella teleta TaxID=283909 RepID=R7T3N8_CAPTE|nr:hypothetical protein CAPTEDRAFT_150102 [Capitella teleta]|eukprot:ELT87338.1 hypothetical protein CAPTEDRAFT_150102 [Capitella teleta]